MFLFGLNRNLPSRKQNKSFCDLPRAQEAQFPVELFPLFLNLEDRKNHNNAWKDEVQAVYLRVNEHIGEVLLPFPRRFFRRSVREQ